MWISIDPGLSGTGWAVWERRTLKASGSVSQRGDDWYVRATAIADKVNTIAADWVVTKAFFELPQFIQGRYEVNASGDLVKLCVTTGLIMGRLPAIVVVEPVRVIDWKGQLSKELTLTRVSVALSTRGYKLQTATTHEVDAVGIGLYKLGEF